jgi:hypothetical protein
MKWKKSDSDEKRVDIRNAHDAGVDETRRRQQATKRRPHRTLRVKRTRAATSKNILFHRHIFDSKKYRRRCSPSTITREPARFRRGEERSNADVENQNFFSSRDAVTPSEASHSHALRKFPPPRFAVRASSDTSRRRRETMPKV